jgi:PPOX class probable F420-dependent enzyme
MVVFDDLLVGISNYKLGYHDQEEEREMKLPPVVSESEWEAAHNRLLVKEKEATRARDALAAERRRLPMVKIEKDYVFEGPDGPARLVDLFDGRRQLILYHFMFAPGVDGWPSAGCDGCSMFVDNVGHLAHLHARDTSFVLVSRAPLTQIEPYRRRMGWTIPWFSSAGSDFNVDFGVTVDERETFGLSVFIREGAAVYRTYFTAGRGAEALGSDWTFLDLTPFGRQETWEDSPEGWPQGPPYEWWRRHDEYDDPPESSREEEPMAQLPEAVRTLFEGPNQAHIATLRPNGDPHTVPVWVGIEGDRIAFLTGPGSRKARNLEHDPRVAISITDREQPFTMAEISGRVTERLEGDAAFVVIDRISHKDIGQPYPLRADRVVYLVEPERAWAQSFA